MGCCNNSNSSSLPSYNSLIFHILKSHPMRNLAWKDCRNEYVSYCKQPQLNSITTICKSKSHKVVSAGLLLPEKIIEQNYISAIEKLYNFKCETDINILFNAPKASKSVNNIVGNTLKKEIEAALRGLDEKGSDFLLFEDPSHDKPINTLFLSITPTYNDLFDTLIKDKPESSFLLFTLGFCKDNFSSKSSLLLKICETAGLKANIINLKLLLQTYLEFNIAISQRVLNALRSSDRSIDLIDSIQTEFEIRIDKFVIDEWIEYEAALALRKTSISSSIAFKVSKELLNIIITGTTLASLDDYKQNSINKLDNLSLVEIGELMLSNSIVLEDQLTTLQTLHPYIFNVEELQRLVINQIKLETV